MANLEPDRIESLQEDIKVLIGRVECLEKSDKDQTVRLNIQKGAGVGVIAGLALLSLVIVSDGQNREEMERVLVGVIVSSVAAYVGSSAVKSQ